ncbi:MAG TPA: SCO family protein, partial [Bdellovibrionales bacterium]|nr:SCO family protein [Bdellovibrionales bacterium]
MRWSGVFASLALVAFAAALWPKQTDESVRPARSHSAESGLEWPERTSFQAAWRAGRLEPRKPDQRLPYFSGRALVPVADESAKDLVRIPKLVLIDQHGRARNEKLFKGRPTVLAFFSTTCTGSCPNALDALKRLEESLRDPREMQFVGVTADPLHDSPDTLR